ncbi:MAG TPA: XdhC/CoxI family protein [Bacteroidetes bacterium]|nr:XdhC/CoxI family protein [Bacteroidota bacterium]
MWNFIKNKIKKDIATVLLYVLESSGSSPGRQGFKMAVAADGEICGSIGGGIMEHKWVETARDILQKKEDAFIYKKQIHNKTSATEQSGMICSGEQKLVLIFLNKKIKKELNKLFETLAGNENGTLVIQPGNLFFKKNIISEKPFLFKYKNENEWEYSEQVNFKNILHIIGGGHVGLAFSRLMSTLGFYIKIYDDRKGLNTMQGNSFADEKIILDYKNIGEKISDGRDQYAVIMTFGYRSDKIVLKQLLNKNFRYIGMMGSAAKTGELYKELKAEGVKPELLEKVHAPIGLPISSKTPAEIAVSIAAEIISEKNKQ